MDRRLMAFLLSYTFATLAHFMHNAEFLSEYPNMPGWLDRSEVYGAWLMVAAVGLAGYLFCRSGYRTIGLVLIAIYGLLGLDGLTHYALAPMSAHTSTMNSTIWLEAITGVALSVLALSELLKAHKTPMPAGR